MDFVTKEDIAAPIEAVFAEISRPEPLEAVARRRGAQVSRKDSGPLAEGSAWEVGFSFRGRSRVAQVRVTRLEPPHRLECATVIDGLEAQALVELEALAAGRTRMVLTTGLAPKSLSARLLVQSLKLARGKIDKRFHLRVAEYARDLETRLAGA